MTDKKEKKAAVPETDIGVCFRCCCFCMGCFEDEQGIYGGQSKKGSVIAMKET